LIRHSRSDEIPTSGAMHAFYIYTTLFTITGREKQKHKKSNKQQK